MDLRLDVETLHYYHESSLTKTKHTMKLMMVIVTNLVRNSSASKMTYIVSGGALNSVYGQNGDKSKRRQVKTATPKWRQKWLYSKRRQTQTTPTVLVKPKLI